MQKKTLEIIGKKEIEEAGATLARYKRGKAGLDRRLAEDELWWELRHREATRRDKKPQGVPEPASAWLFNAILNKHADATDNFPEPLVLPREPSDEESADTLSQVLPAVLENCDFDKTYSDNWWEKLKHGTAAYGVFWNPEKEEGLGDIDVRRLDLLKVFWEPGVTDVQQSRSLFLIELRDTDLLEKEYPGHEGKLSDDGALIKEYLYDDAVDVSNKSAVVDWYYKVRDGRGRTALHFAKFVGSELLYASQNDPLYAERGFYAHGKYPVVFDVLFPEKGTPVGFGYVAVCKDPQLYIDRLSGSILENALIATKKRFFIGGSTNVNREQFADINESFVDVEGDISERAVKEIEVRPLDPVYLSVLNLKIEEIKDTAANRDVNSGGVGSGVTAAAAVRALQEAGNKASRDMIETSYRAYNEINRLIIELMREFYDEKRVFRVTGKSGGREFCEISNKTLFGAGGGARSPVFDLKIRAR
ncbi:MAG: hypothetical protein IJS65_08300, partial [Clostridia bacterium]|nr:hypothetical protein [Clostridia bacterium]